MDGVNVNKRLDGAVSWNTLCLKVLNGTHINPQLLSHVSLVSVVAVKVTQLIYLTKLIDSMLPCICSVIDHR